MPTPAAATRQVASSATVTQDTTEMNSIAQVSHKFNLKLMIRVLHVKETLYVKQL